MILKIRMKLIELIIGKLPVMMNVKVNVPKDKMGIRTNAEGSFLCVKNLFFDNQEDDYKYVIEV